MIARRVAVVALAAGALGVGASRAQAQAELLGGGAVFVAGGVSHVGTAGLDERLEANGYPTFGQTAVSVGFGAYRILSGGVMLSIEANPFFVGQESHEGRDVGLGGGYATLGVGYAIRVTPRVRVYPRFGLGAGGIALEIAPDADTTAFDDVLAEPTPAPIEQDPVLSRDGVVFDVGGGAEFLTGGDRGALIGVRLGYLFAPWDDRWDLIHQGQARRGPDASIAGPYARLAIGLGWRR